MAERNTFVGLDVHKDSIAVALAESGRFGEVRHYGTVGGECVDVDRAAGILAMVHEGEQRVVRLTDQLRALVPAWRWAPVVEALQALRGVSFVTATVLVAEIGDIQRFTKARELMAYLGLVPSERSSGPSTRRGHITKAGNPHARRVLAEAAWAYRGIPRIGPVMQKRQEGLPTDVRTLAWKAQLRLCGRFRRLSARGKPRVVVATAIARELTGFVWALAREVPRP